MEDKINDSWKDGTFYLSNGRTYEEIAGKILQGFAYVQGGAEWAQESGLADAVLGLGLSTAAIRGSVTGGVKTKIAGTVWDDIKATQPNIEGTQIPKSFELSVDGKKYWVNPNGTKHMAEYSTRTLSHGQKMTEQQLLTSLKGAVGEAAISGYKYNIPVRAGNWELIFSPPRQKGQLPVVKHALYIPEGGK
ncbi:hypothetical protein [Listeria costaricensis]|uniref:hypothetical protein n=1 Tax=Listeria costaricensis TaxID=2026604 RepID=UPI0013C3EADD|nr:hypothetical protein [Listeria costaricensis]